MVYSQQRRTKGSISLLSDFVTVATLIFSAVSACDDVPPDSRYSCHQQAVQWSKCNEPWMKDKCNKSCGRCQAVSTCDDVPPDSRYSCHQQAVQWSKCNEPWMKDKCNRSCGRCQDVSACDDVPPDSRYSCHQQAVQWSKCNEPWMKDKCNKSCGRCQAVSTCDDVPPDSRYSCHQQAVQWSKCNEPWMKDKCNKSCGRCQDVSACDDVPPDSRYSCHQQAVQWSKCDEPWMKDKCNKSCGRCKDTPPKPPVSNNGQRDGVTTRYWDCCKASCGWAGKAFVTIPVKTCARDGITPIDVNTQSGCNGGSGYMCSNQQPWEISSTLSYGFAAANIAGQKESDWCCTCYSLTFTTGPVTGKKLIVQVTNTGGDLGQNHFDIQMPGGGVGTFDGCSKQFSEVSKSSWGQTYGGIDKRSDCNKLPSVLQSGCFWRFDWFKNADNPEITFEEVSCPAALVEKTGCVRK